MNFSLAKTATAVASIAFLSLALVGCGSEAPVSETSAGVDSSAEPSNNASPEDDSQQSDAPQGGDGDYAFGATRDDMVTAIEKSFSSDNATATWEGDRLILAIDGDADGVMSGLTECVVLGELLLETDTASIAFPNGTIACEELMGG